ncbi:MAG: diaminopimelate decarboxylase [Eubacteriales bacterium]|nr:diaminopimelate decarboxylase [Eubacteriales bacterium]
MKTESFLQKTNFLAGHQPEELLAQYGSPLYVYNEQIFRDRCHDMQSLVDYERFTANYSIKANSNINLLAIAREEGMYADAMSPGEILFLEQAGYSPEQIFFVPNNVSREELQFAIDHNVLTSLDSISQLDLFGQLNPGGRVAIRINPGVGAGHHEKVVTGGKKTKFGISMDQMDQVQTTLKRYQLHLVGVNQHIGSLFMEPQPYLEAARHFLSLAEQFSELELVDFGGGFGIPYHKLEGQERLDLQTLKHELTALIRGFVAKYKRPVLFKSEPGRYVVAESGVLLGTVHAVKQNDASTFVGTDLGFNVLARPMMYDSWHDIEVFHQGELQATDGPLKTVSVVGNICESGDIIAKHRELPPIVEGDVLAVLDAGAYGYAMSSTYNNRLRPAEILIQKDGQTRLIRRREVFEDLFRTFEF